MVFGLLPEPISQNRAFLLRLGAETSRLIWYSLGSKAKQHIAVNRVSIRSLFDVIT